MARGEGRGKTRGDYCRSGVHVDRQTNADRVEGGVLRYKSEILSELITGSFITNRGRYFFFAAASIISHLSFDH